MSATLPERTIEPCAVVMYIEVDESVVVVGPGPEHQI